MPTKEPYIFISYKSEEREFAQRVRHALALSTDASIWWDQDLQTGGKWSADLDLAIANAACILVLWSKVSVESDWVQQECAVGKSANKLVPALIEDCEIPVPYQQIQTANLGDWDGSELHPEFVKLTNAALKLLSEKTQHDENTSIEIKEITRLKGAQKWLGRILPSSLLTLVTLILMYSLFATNAQVENLRCLTDELREISASRIKRDLLMMNMESLGGEHTLLIAEQQYISEELEKKQNKTRLEHISQQIKAIDEMIAEERLHLDNSDRMIGQEVICEKNA